MKDLLVRLLAHERKTLEHAVFQRISIKLSEYYKLNRIEQMAYLVEMLEKDTSSALKQGINRFETLLDAVGLSGKVPEDTSRAIFELQQVRNVIAHRNGRCDKRLRSQCPWLRLKLGQKVEIRARQLAVYHTAASDYALEVLYRVGDRYNCDLRATKKTAPPPT
ncbi:hypothetical protein [Tahibacter sp.]|uniref:hypothetical protein n=1 Tax=Tahibacter sp. TaxID=2056211 RepID=UPI0028C4E06E|nr:hypothetical protein [Tahibacter sp.]